MLRVPVAHDNFVCALLDSTRLSPTDALDRGKLEAADADLLGEWTRIWRITALVSSAAAAPPVRS